MQTWPEIRAWSPGAPLTRGSWDIPVPADGPPVQPTVLLVPLLGFDGHGDRLGDGGGYYDRTLANFAVKPLTIGIGQACNRLDTLYPQSSDIPMDSVLTDEGWCDLGRYRSPATSSPCQMAEAPAAYMGFIDSAALVTVLNELVMAKRAGERPSHSTCDFFLKLTAIDDLYQQMTLLNRNQSWMIGKVREMLDGHLENLNVCDAWLAADGQDREEA